MDLDAATGAAVVAELCVLCCLLAEVPFFAGMALVAVAVIGGAFESASLGWEATAFEAAAFCLAGVLFAVWSSTPPLLLALPVLIGVIALVMGGGPVGETGGAGDLLVLNLPGTDVALAGADAAFLGVYGTWALRSQLRLSSTAVVLVGGTALAAATENDVAGLAITSLGFLLVNADRLWLQFRTTS